MGADQINNEREAIKTLLGSTKDIITYLYQRWQDEKEYEDFAGYEKKMKEQAEKIQGIKFLKAIKRPFGFQFALSKSRYELGVRISGNYLKIECKRLGIYSGRPFGFNEVPQ